MLPIYASWAISNELGEEVLTLKEIIRRSEAVVSSVEKCISVDTPLMARADRANKVAFESNHQSATLVSFAIVAAYTCARCASEYFTSGSRSSLEPVLDYAEDVITTDGMYGYESMRKDAQCAEAIEKARFPEYGSCFDPGERGPLGCLWASSPPDWYHAGMEIMQELELRKGIPR